MKKYKWYLIGGAFGLGVVLAYEAFQKWKGTGTGQNAKAGTFSGWLLNKTGLKKDSGYNS